MILVDSEQSSRTGQAENIRDRQNIRNKIEAFMKVCLKQRQKSDYIMEEKDENIKDINNFFVKSQRLQIKIMFCFFVFVSIHFT